MTFFKKENILFDFKGEGFISTRNKDIKYNLQQVQFKEILEYIIQIFKNVNA